MTLIPKHRPEDFSPLFAWLQPFSPVTAVMSFATTIMIAAGYYRVWHMTHTFDLGALAFVLMLAASVVPTFQFLAVATNYIYARRHRGSLYRDYGRALQGVAVIGIGLAGLLLPRIVATLVIHLAR